MKNREGRTPGRVNFAAREKQRPEEEKSLNLSSKRGPLWSLVKLYLYISAEDYSFFKNPVSEMVGMVLTKIGE